MIERLTPRFRGLDKNLQIFPRGFLTGEIRKGQGPQGYLTSPQELLFYTRYVRVSQFARVMSATAMTIKFAKSESIDVREKLRGRGIDVGYLTYLFCSRSALL
jgi:hypothetical protein